MHCRGCSHISLSYFGSGVSQSRTAAQWRQASSDFSEVTRQSGNGRKPKSLLVRKKLGQHINKWKVLWHSVLTLQATLNGQEHIHQTAAGLPWDKELTTAFLFRWFESAKYTQVKLKLSALKTNKQKNWNAIWKWGQHFLLSQFPVETFSCFLQICARKICYSHAFGFSFAMDKKKRQPYL